MTSPITDKEIQSQEFLIACLTGETNFLPALLRVTYHGQERACIVAVEKINGGDAKVIPLAVLVDAADMDGLLVPGGAALPRFDPSRLGELFGAAVAAFEDDEYADPDEAFDADERRVGILAGLYYSTFTELEPPAGPEGHSQDALDFYAEVIEGCREYLVSVGYVFDRP